MHEWEDNDIITWVFDDGFVPTAKLTNAGNFSIVSDHLGTPVEAYDAEGGLVWSAELDIYGRVIEHTGDVDFVPFRYQGQYADVETGLYYNRFRYYDPAIGQYTQQDPIGLAGNNPTLYAYVADTNAWVDVFGLDPIDQKTRDLLVKITGGYDGQGIYVFPGNSGKPYVGQSGNIIERISQHLRSGKLSPDNLEALTFDKTSLSKQALNDAEAKKMADLGGRNNLENIRRPPHTGDLSDEDLSKENTPSCSERA